MQTPYYIIIIFFVPQTPQWLWNRRNGEKKSFRVDGRTTEYCVPFWMPVTHVDLVLCLVMPFLWSRFVNKLFWEWNGGAYSCCRQMCWMPMKTKIVCVEKSKIIYLIPQHWNQYEHTATGTTESWLLCAASVFHCLIQLPSNKTSPPSPSAPVVLNFTFRGVSICVYRCADDIHFLSNCSLVSVHWIINVICGGTYCAAQNHTKTCFIPIHGLSLNIFIVFIYASEIVFRMGNVRNWKFGIIAPFFLFSLRLFLYTRKAKQNSHKNAANEHARRSSTNVGFVE